LPTYEYACQKCGEHFELFQSFSAKPLKKHAECGGELKKVIHARGVVFKGSGFYATDSKPKKSSSSESSSDAGSSEGSKSTGDSKTAGDSKTDKPKKADKPTSADSSKASSSSTSTD
jgi:putative FmdB family regulatory protein